MGNTILGKAIIDPVVAEIVEKSLLHIGGLGIGVDIAQGIEHPPVISIRKPRAVVSLFPKMPSAI